MTTEERNLEALIRSGALPLGDEVRRRARERFLAATGRPEARRSALLPGAAAALLLGALLFWTTRSVRAPERPEPPGLPLLVPDPVLSPLSGDREEMSGRLRTPPRLTTPCPVTFLGRSPLPDGTLFRVMTYAFSSRFESGALRSTKREIDSQGIGLQRGAFEISWPLPAPGRVRVDVSAPDELQSKPVLKTLTLPETRRVWSFEFAAWDDGLVDRLAPALDVVGSVSRDLREFIGKVESACAVEAEFKTAKARLVAEGHLQQTRIQTVAATTLYPAALEQLFQAARHFTGSLEYFAWKGGVFLGPISYHADNQPLPTHRQEPWRFDRYRFYADEAAALAGREFGLWLLEDFRKGGSRPAHAAAVRASAAKPGVAEFAARLEALPTEDLPRLEEELRRLGK